MKQKQYNAQKKSVIDENHNKFMNGGATQGYVTKDNNMKIWPKIDLFFLETSFKKMNKKNPNTVLKGRTSLHQILPNNLVVHIFMMVSLQGHFEVKSS